MLLLGALTISSALAWSNRGHEEVSRAAVSLMAERRHPLSGLLLKNEATLERLACTPDTEWRGEAVQNIKRAKRKTPSRSRIEFQEQGLHYFEVDAFLRMGVSENNILMMPAGEYAQAREKYAKLLRDNLAYVLEFDRKQGDPEAYGTAPWRVLQLYGAAVDALRARDVKGALLYLGVLSHYVADLAEPLNTTLNFDGRHYPIPATGVYAAFEDRIFDVEQGPTGSARVLREANTGLGDRGLDGLTRERVVPELLKLVNGGYELIDPLLRAFSEQCGKAQGRGLASVARERNGKRKKGTVSEHEEFYCEPPLDAASSRGLVQSFATSPVSARADDEEADSVLEVAEERLGDAAALVARLWAAAYNEAGRPSLESASAYRYEELGTTERYLLPSYLGSAGSRSRPAAR